MLYTIKIKYLTKISLLVLTIAFVPYEALLASPVFSNSFSSVNSAINYIPGEIIVKFKKDATNSAHRNIITVNGHSVKKILDKSGRLYHISVGSGQTVSDGLAQYQADPNVEYAQPNYIYQAMAIPNDPYFNEQWALQNNGQRISTATYTTNNPGVVGMDMDAVDAWNYITDCRSIVVAVIDTGVNYTQLDLAGNMWDGGVSYPNHGWDFVDNDNDPMPVDGSNHGTLVAGTIGATGNNGIGITGMCWKVQLMALRAGNVDGFTSASLIQSIDFATQHGAKLINMSLGGSSPDPAVFDSIQQAETQGTLVVVAAGNDNTDNDQTPVYPCNDNLPNILCVAALDQAYQLAGFSNYGLKSVDIGAPGTNIFGTAPGPDITDNFIQGWTLTGGWTQGQCNLSIGLTDMLVDPVNWCQSGTYADNADDIAYKQFDLSTVSGAGLQFYAFIQTQQNADYFRVNANPNGGDPFVNGTPLFATSGATQSNAIVYQLGLSDCLTKNCSLGFQLTSDSSITSSGIGIFLFQVQLAAKNSNNYSVFSGTSSATPEVTGLAALIWAYNPNYTYQDVANSIMYGGNTVPALENITATGNAADAYGSLRYINPPSGISAALQ